MKYIIIIFICFSFSCNIITSGIILTKKNEMPSSYFNKEENNFNMDYSKLHNWAFRSDYHDYKDLLPRNLKNKGKKFSNINMFYIHPTTLYFSERWNSDTSSFDKDKVLRMSLENQASCFAGITNIYAPNYRQMHIHSYIDTVNGYQAFNLAYNDVLNAFKYFIDEINKDQYFIIVGHSQGTNHAVKLISEYISQDTSIYKKLVLSYLIGMDIKKDLLPIPPCNQEDDLYCFLSWRTFQEFQYPSSRTWKYGNHIASINPITWKTDTIASEKYLHKGILFPNRSLKFKRSLSAYNHQGMLWIKKPKKLMLRLYPSSNYHPTDFNLYWMNIRENLEKRLNTLSEKNYLSRTR